MSRSDRAYPEITWAGFHPDGICQKPVEHMSPGEFRASAEAFRASAESLRRSKYHREIKPGVFVDIYDVLAAWKVTNPALSHLIKKALQPGDRGHKTLAQDMQDIVDSAVRARELAE